MREKTVEDEFKDATKRLGGMALKFVPMYFAGFPDRMALLPGARIVFVELKAPGKDARPLQRSVHRKLIALGFTVLIIDTLEGVLAWESSERELSLGLIR